MTMLNLNISDREKNLLKILGGVVILIIVYTFIIDPFFLTENNDTAAITKQNEQLKKLNDTYEKYNIAKQKNTKYDSLFSNKTENLSSQIDKLLLQHNLKDSLGRLSRSPKNLKNKFEAVSYNFKLNAISIQPLLKFLNDIEKSNQYVKIKSLIIKKVTKASNDDRYDATINIETYIKK